MAYLLIKMNLTLRVARRQCSPEIPERPETSVEIAASPNDCRRICGQAWSVTD